MDFVSKSIRKKYYYEKGFGFEAIEDIPKNTIIIKEASEVNLFDMNIKNNSIYEMFYIIYRCINHTNENIKKDFLKLAPNHIGNEKFIIQYKDLYKCINGLPNDKIRTFFKSLNKDELFLYCLKYTRNVFGYWTYYNYSKSKRTPVVLFNGAILNHSCIPNIVFTGKENRMYFITTRDIKAGEEISDSYIDLTLDKYERQKRLLTQYGFLCKCDRCKANDRSHDIVINEIEKFKKKLIEKFNEVNH